MLCTHQTVKWAIKKFYKISTSKKILVLWCARNMQQWHRCHVVIIIVILSQKLRFFIEISLKFHLQQLQKKLMTFRMHQASIECGEIHYVKMPRGKIKREWVEHENVFTFSSIVWCWWRVSFTEISLTWLRRREKSHEHVDVIANMPKCSWLTIFTAMTAWIIIWANNIVMWF